MKADTNRVRLAYSKETVWAETPSSPTMQALRYTGHGLVHNKAQAISTEIRSDRQVPSIIRQGVTMEGPVNYEFSNKTFEDFIAAALGRTSWTTISLTGLALTFNHTAKTVVRGGGTPTVATLTQVTVDTLYNTAEYAYASHTGPAPAIGDVIVNAGFTIGGNNVTGTIIDASGGASGTYVLALSTQANETHAGTGTTTHGTSWVTDGVKVGLWVWFPNAVQSKNHGPFKVASISDDYATLTMTDPDGNLTDEVLADGSCKTKYVRNGVDKTSFLFEEDFTDLTNQFVQFLGLHLNEWSMDLTAQAVVKGAFTFFGKEGIVSDATVAGSVTDSGTTPVVSASADVAAVQVSDVDAVAGLKALAITLINNLRHRPIIGTPYDDDHGFGQFNVKLTGTALVPDLALFSACIDHTTVPFDIPIFDQLGNWTVISLPAMKLTGNPKVTGANQDVDMDLTGEGQYDATGTYMAQVCVFEAA